MRIEKAAVSRAKALFGNVPTGRILGRRGAWEPPVTQFEALSRGDIRSDDRLPTVKARLAAIQQRFPDCENLAASLEGNGRLLVTSFRQSGLGHHLWQTFPLSEISLESALDQLEFCVADSFGSSIGQSSGSPPTNAGHPAVSGMS
jgi:hypothetical protein